MGLTEVCKKKKKKTTHPGRTPFVVSFAQTTAVSQSGFALLLLPAAPRACPLRGQAPAPTMGAPPDRVPLLDASRETPQKTAPVPARCSNPQEGNAQGASRG